MSEPKPGRIAVPCPECGAKLGVPESAVGRKAKCPKCEHRFIISPPTPAPPPKSQALDDDDPGSLLEDLVADQHKAAAMAQPAGTGVRMTCEQCGTSLPADAKLCVACGFNVATGRSHKLARTQPSKAAKAAKSAGTFVLGCVLSGVGALVGAAIWSIVAVITKYELGWIAWGVGLLAGGGMILGYRKQNQTAGLVAAFMALFGVVAAKIMIFAFLIYVVVTGATGSVNLQRELLKGYIAEEILDDRGVTSEKQRETEFESAYAEAEQRVDRMSDDEVERRWEEEYAGQAEPSVADAEPQPQPDAEPTSPREPEYGESEFDDGEEADASGALALFFSAMFHPLDILFILLAIGSAYKLGTGGGSED